jgi:hypothetical protein
MTTDDAIPDPRMITAGGLTIGAGVAVIVLGPQPLPLWCAAIAVALRLTSSGQYAVAVLRRRARPNIVTWFLWGLTPMIAVAAQLDDRPGAEVLVTFVIGLGPLVVSAVALCTDRSASRLTPFTLLCGGAALVGIVLWQVTDRPVLAIVFCIVADLFATLPTLRKAWADPGSEYAPSYLVSVLAALAAFGVIEHRDLTAAGFPLYLFVINAALFVFAAAPLARMGRRGARESRAVRYLLTGWPGDTPPGPRRLDGRQG